LRTTRDKRFTRHEIRRLGILGGLVALLHLVGWTLFVWYARSNPALAGLGTLAYTFGLRHAFDADHIAAIDNTARKLLQDGRRSMGVGFFFSLGHSSIVLGLTAALAFATKAVGAKLPTLQSYGGVVGASVSGVFLVLIGLLNLAVLLDIFGVFRAMKRGRYDEEKLERRLLDQGLMSRVFFKRLGDKIDKSWKMYPLGVLFGLGFDTASEVALLAVAAGVATHHVPFLAVLSLPILFAAGMSLMDTIDGAFMSRAYGWAFSSPVRKVYYNMTVTSLSVVVALVIGGAELVQVLINRGPDLARLGYLVVGLFAATWIVSGVIWKVRGIERRWTAQLEQ
jgi:high-affinity nickel-transport protein